jgi:GNAT superfamily N-acetyltransferase
MRIKLIEDIEDAREHWADFQHHTHGPEFFDKWPGDDHIFWLIIDEKQDIGMMSAVYRPEKGYVYLSYAIIIPSHQAKGLQRKLIQHRLRWAKRQGAFYAVTYTLMDNYPSIMNLLRCGFKFAKEPRGWSGYGPGVHYFEKQL